MCFGQACTMESTSSCDFNERRVLSSFSQSSGFLWSFTSPYTAQCPKLWTLAVKMPILRHLPWLSGVSVTREFSNHRGYIIKFDTVHYGKWECWIGFTSADAIVESVNFHMAWTIRKKIKSNKKKQKPETAWNWFLFKKWSVKSRETFLTCMHG